MAIPAIYRKNLTKAAANYDWIDISNGAGYATFYLCNSQAGYFLTPETLYSELVVWKSAALGIVADVKIFDDTFTTTLNSPRTVNGTVFADIAGRAPNNPSGKTSSLYFIVKFIKISEGTETILGQATSPTGTWTTGVDNHNQYFLVSIPIVNELIRKGDKVGIRLEAYSWFITGGETCYTLIGLDPRNRTSVISGENTLTQTSSTLDIPFRIDI